MTEKVRDYHDGDLHFQDRFDTRKMADRSASRVSKTINPDLKEFIPSTARTSPL